MSIFSCTGYLEFLESFLKSSGAGRGMKKSLAEAASCQPSYFSLVLKGDAHLTLEQSENLCRYLRLNVEETDYFILLVSHARAGTRELKAYFKTKLKQIREANENLGQRIQDVEVMSDADGAVYYSSWMYLAIHIATSVPDLQSDRAIAERLHVSVDAVQRALQFLRRLGLVENEGGNWRSTNRQFHLPRESQFVSLHHGNWRRRAVDNAFLQNAEDLHYTGVSSIARQDIEVLRARILELIDESRTIIGPSKEEELICFSVDLFRL